MRKEKITKLTCIEFQVDRQREVKNNTANFSPILRTKGFSQRKLALFTLTKENSSFQSSLLSMDKDNDVQIR